MGKLVLKIILAALDVAALVMLIISAVYYWTISGGVLFALVAVQYIAQTVRFVVKNGAIGLLSVAALVVLGIAVAFPVVIVGMGAPAYCALFVLGAVAALFSAGYTFSEIK